MAKAPAKKAAPRKAAAKKVNGPTSQTTPAAAPVVPNEDIAAHEHRVRNANNPF